MKTHHTREKWLFIYTGALDRGDLDTLADVLARAADDPILGELIAEMNAEYHQTQFDMLDSPHPPTPSPSQWGGGVERSEAGVGMRPLNGNPQEENTMSVISRPYPIKPRTLPRVQGWTAAAAAIAVMLFVGLMLSVQRNENRSSWQPEAWTFDDLVPITAENAHQLTRLTTIGRGSIYDVVWSPDGTTMSVATQTGVYQYNTADFSQESKLPGYEDAAHNIVYTSDGSRLIISGADTIDIRDSATGEALQRFPIEDDFSMLGLHTDGVHLVVMDCSKYALIGGEQVYCAEGSIDLLHIETGEQSTLLASVYPWYTTLSPDGSLLVTTSQEGNDPNEPQVEIYLWDLLSDLSEPVQIVEPKVDLYSVRFSPDSEKLMYISGSTGPTRVHVKDITTEDAPSQNIIITQGDTGHIFNVDSTAILFSRTARAAHEPRNALINHWEFAKGGGGERFEIEAIDTLLQALYLSPDGKTLAAKDNTGALWVIDVRDWANPQVLHHSTEFASDIRNLVFSPADSYLAYASSNQYTVWNYETNTQVDSILSNLPRTTHFVSTYPGNYLTFGADGDLVFVNESTPETGPAEFGIWNPTDGFSEYIDENLRVSGNIHAIDITADGVLQIIYTLYQQDTGVFRLSRSGKTETETKILNAHLVDVSRSITPTGNDAEFSLDGRFVAVVGCFERSRDEMAQSSCDRKGISVLDTGSGDLVTVVETDFQDIYRAANPQLFSDDSGRLLLAASGGVDVAYIREEGMLQQVFEGGYVVHVWDLTGILEGTAESAELLYTFDAPFYGIYGVAFSPDGSLLAVTGYSDQQPAVYDLQNGEQVATLSSELFATSVEFNQDGTILAVGGGGVVNLWGVLPSNR